jgi:hypothetical protein
MEFHLRLMTIAFAIAVLPLTASAQDVPKELQKLKGTWRLTTLVVNGKAIQPTSTLTLVIKGDEAGYGSEKATIETYTKIK